MILPTTEQESPRTEPAVPFPDNVTFLTAKSLEAMLWLERAAATCHRDLPGGADRAPRGGDPPPVRVRRPTPCEPGEAAGESPPDAVARRLAAARAENRARLAASDPAVVPFLGLVRRFDLSEAEQDVVWLLFFMATSPDFRRRFIGLGLERFGSRHDGELCIGDILHVLYPGDYRGQLAGRALFRSDGTLMGRTLIRSMYRIGDEDSILSLPVTLAGRVIQWITADENQYAAEMPFRVERPATRLDQVVLPESTLGPVLRLVEQYDEYLRQRRRLGLDAIIEYGRAMVILEYGPPGTGKTLLARALSHHIGRPLVSQIPERPAARTGGDPFEYGGKRPDLDLLFREAQLQDGIVFIDECEDLCRPTSPRLRELLVELEKTDALVILATNQPGGLAPALDRRITLKVPFEIPDAPLRRRIWKLLLPDTLPIAEDVDLDALARAHPFAGGYIKNAVLTAVNFALARAAGGEVRVTQADLEGAARLQECHVAGPLARRKLVNPCVRLADCTLSKREREHLARIIRSARNYPELMRRWNPVHDPGPCRGLKVLFYGDNPGGAWEAATALAAELGVRINLLYLQDLVRGGGDGDRKSSGLDLSEVFKASADAGLVTVLLDNFGVLGRMNGDLAPLCVLDRFADSDGIGVVVSTARRVPRHQLGHFFHERLRFGPPDTAARAAYWRNVTGSIPLAPDVSLDVLARDFPLDFDSIRYVLHRACLLQAAEDPEAPLGADAIRRAAADFARDNRRGPLFGGFPP